MSEEWPPTAARRPDPGEGPRRRRRGPLVPTLVVLAVLVIGFIVFAETFTEYLWFRQLGFQQVLTTRLVTQTLLFVAGAAAMATAVWVSLSVAYRTRPIYAPSTPEQASLDRYRETLEPLRRLVAIAVPATLGLFAGSAAASQWRPLLLALNSQSFGRTDPIFTIDVGFYVFQLPFLEFAVGFATAVVLLSGLSALVTHYLYGGLRVGGPGERTTPQARVHLAVLAALFLLVRAVGYWLERYTILGNESDLFAGPGYTDVNAVIPARTVLAAATALVALAFLWTAARGNWRVPALGVGLLVVVAIVAGGVLPRVIQSFLVGPNLADRERRFIQYNIDSTRVAYGLDSVQEQAYDVSLQAERGALAADARTLPGVRLLDPDLVPPTFRQLQQIRPFYQFPDPLDVSRYTVTNADGTTSQQDTVLAAREVNLNGLPSSQRNWINDHTVYTHGFGLVAAFGNRRTPDGEPVFFQSGIPPQGALGDFQQRIYFGENSPEYSIVGGPADQDLEFDYPSGGEDVVRFTYDGGGGVPVGDPFRRLLFAIKFRAEQIILSDRVNSESKVLFDRNPRERVEKVAPWLTLDGDPYPAVVGDKVLWILDGYTTTPNYPYSRSTTLAEATATSLTQNGATSVQPLANRQVNYVRNSVKATVDAYSGEVTLYAWDAEDPVLKAWSQALGNSVTPLSEVSGELMSQFRYPQDLFKVQREVLERYHVTDVGDFFSGTDFWSVPPDPTSSATDARTTDAGLQPPYYLSLQMPGAEEPSFSLTSTFIPNTQGQSGTQRNILRGFLSADGDAGNEQGVVREDYGRLRLLTIAEGEPIPGPGQVQNEFNSNSEIGQQLNVLRIGQSRVLQGNLLTLPVGGGLLYVQPVYVQSQSETSYPLLRRVLVAFGNQVGFGDTLDAALDDVFGGDSGAVAPDSGVTGTAGGTGTGDGTTPTPDPTGSGTDGDPSAQLAQALQDANQAIQEGQTALAAGDFAAYGQAQTRLQDAIERALAADAVIRGEPVPGSATDTPTDGTTGPTTGSSTGGSTGAAGATGTTGNGG